MANFPTTAQMMELENVPALAPPPGVIPNFTVFNERAELYNILCSILLVIVYVCLMLRLYAKVWIKRSPGFDDCKILIIVSPGINSLTFAVACVLGTVSRDYMMPLQL